MIYIIRHGVTDLNKAHVLQGRSDYPLNEEGVVQAQKAGKLLKGISFSHVFSSPLKRAVQTAEIVCPDMNITVDKRLIEMNYGPYEGADLNNLPQEVIYFFKDFIHHEAPIGMETLEEVVRRSGKFMENIRSLKGDILISTHAIAMKGILEYLTPESKGSYWSRYIGNCAIYCLDNESGNYSIPAEFENDILEP